jgi:hypothetical protein
MQTEAVEHPLHVSGDVAGVPRGPMRWLWRHAIGLSRLAAYVSSALVAAPFLYHLAHGSNAFLGLLEDDYYYYAIIADKFLTVGKLTYDGTTLTNGFHPLWFAVITALRVVCGRFGSVFYVALTLMECVSMCLTYELSRRFASVLGASPRQSAIIAAVYSFGTAQLLTDGMECVVAVPLILWLFVELAREGRSTPRRAAKLGLISSLAILARLDIAIIVPFFIGGYLLLARPQLRSFARGLIAFCAGGVLVPLYAVANAVFLGSPFPVSALAKRLITAQGFSLSYVRAVAMFTVYGSSMAIVLPMGLVALWLLLRTDARERPAARFAGGLAITYVFIFFGINALSGWIYFGWYAFPFVPATIAAMVFICERWTPPVRIRLQLVTATLLVALAPVLAVRYYIEHGPRWSISDNGLVAMSYELADQMRGREGLFAMGAIAGIATYVLDKPVLQAEGLVADRRLVDHIEREDSLGDVLREYHVDYLVVSLATVRPERRDGCYLVTQPNAEWAGKRTAKMRGEICAEPIAHFITQGGAHPWSVFQTLETLVWDIRGARWRNADDVDSFRHALAIQRPDVDR